MTTNFSKNLNFLRKQQGISQLQLANILDVDRSTVSRWENGNMDATIGYAIKISKVFKVPIDDLLTKNLEIQNKNSKDVKK